MGPHPGRSGRRRGTTRKLSVFILTLFAIEFLDEFVFGAREAAWPLIRTDLGLSYTQVGLLLGLPGLTSSLIEPVIGILGDVWRRRILILGGGVAFALALVMMAMSHGFPVLITSFILLYPASGAFVTLSQATLMDTNPDRREQNMVRWTLAGSVGVVAGPIALGVATTLELGWRRLFLIFAGLTLIPLAAAYRFRLTSEQHTPQENDSGLRAGIVDALRAMRRVEVLRWLALLECSDLMLDVLMGFLALYFVDVAGMTPAQAGVAVAVWSGVGLLGTILMIPLLERVRGLRYLRLSAGITLVLFPAFLLIPNIWAKIALGGLLSLVNAGWYSVLQAQLYGTMPGRSGTVMTLDNVFGIVGDLIPMGLGLIAEQFDLTVTMWLLLAGPIALLVGVTGVKVDGRPLVLTC